MPGARSAEGRSCTQGGGDGAADAAAAPPVQLGRGCCPPGCGGTGGLGGVIRWTAGGFGTRTSAAGCAKVAMASPGARSPPCTGADGGMGGILGIDAEDVDGVSSWPGLGILRLGKECGAQPDPPAP